MMPPKAIKELLLSPYYVIYIDDSASNPVYVRVKNLSEDEFKSFIKARDIINNEVLQYNDLLSMVSIALDNLNSAYNSKVEAVKSETALDAREDLVDLNSHFVSYIANFSMYLSNVPRKISSTRTSVLEIHNSVTHDEYDSNFAYRLITNLRNYSLHNTPPITGIRGSRNLGKDPEYEIYIEKKEIIKDSTVERKLRKDFLKPEEHYPVIDNANEAGRSLSTIHWRTIKALLAEVDSSIKYIRDLNDLTKHSGKTPYVAQFKLNAAGTDIDAELHFVPTNVLDILEHVKKY